MYFAPISPTAYLDRYSGRSNVQMCVGCWAIKYPEYYEWYKQRREQGDFVFLDNGAYEGELLNVDEYVRLIRDLKPNVYAIPDVIDNEEETQRLQMEFLKPLTPKSSLPMRVLQSVERDPIYWGNMFRQFAPLFKWIAFPRVLGEHRSPIVHKCSVVRPFINNKIHAFGWTGSVKEVRELAYLGVDTMDSAGPVWRGLNEFDTSTLANNTWQSEGCPFDPTYLIEDHDNSSPNLADDNLTEVFRACVAL